MVQFVPYNRGPSFKERIGASLGQLGQNLAEGLLQRQQNMAENEMLAKLSGREAGDFQGIGPQFKDKLLQGLLREQQEAVKTEGRQKTDFDQYVYDSVVDAAGPEKAKRYAAMGKAQRAIVDRATQEFLGEGDPFNVAFTKALDGSYATGDRPFELGPDDDLGPLDEDNITQSPVYKNASDRQKRKLMRDEQARRLASIGADAGVENLRYKPEKMDRQSFIKAKEANRKTNEETLNQVNERSKVRAADLRDVGLLKNLSERLPSGLSKWLEVDPNTGSLRPTANLFELAPTEAQQWEKIIARFAGRARDSYGARVTNFELETFLKQFPSLLNSPEARSKILEMMEINYKLDQLYDDAYKQVIDYYGKDNISKGDADTLAQELIEEQKEALEEQYNNLYGEAGTMAAQEEGVEGGGEFDELPDPSQHKGKTIRDTESGVKYRSNGLKWEKI